MVSDSAPNVKSVCWFAVECC